MASLKKITRRINSVVNTKQITSAMKMVAVAKLQKAQQQIFSTRDYSEALEEMMSQIASRRRILSHPLFNEVDSNRTLFVVMGSDKGLCGGFNTNMNRHISKKLENKKEDEEIDITVVGKKIRNYFRSKEIPFKKEFVGFFDKPEINHAKQLSDYLVDEFMAGTYNKVVCIYNKFESMLSQEITEEQVLPVRKVNLEKERYKQDFIYDTQEEELIKNVVAEAMKIEVWKIILDSYSAEQAARRTAMENATDNAEDMLRRLTIKKNRIRQSIITTEINEIVSGAEALKS